MIVPNQTAPLKGSGFFLPEETPTPSLDSELFPNTEH